MFVPSPTSIAQRIHSAIMGRSPSGSPGSSPSNEKGTRHKSFVQQEERSPFDEPGPTKDLTGGHSCNAQSTKQVASTPHSLTFALTSSHSSPLREPHGTGQAYCQVHPPLRPASRTAAQPFVRLHALLTVQILPSTTPTHTAPQRLLASPPPQQHPSALSPCEQASTTGPPLALAL